MLSKIGKFLLISLLLISCAKNNSDEPKWKKLNPSLKQRLEAQVKLSESKLSAEVKKIMDEARLALAKSDLSKNFLKVGDVAPDFKLPGANGKNYSLYTGLRNGPVILLFYRGSWCPYCNIQLLALQETIPEITYKGARLIAISPEIPEHGKVLLQKSQLKYSLLSDAGNQISRKYNLVFKLPDDLVEVYKGLNVDLLQSNGDDSYELPVPATFVIGQDRIIKYVFADIDYRKRAEPSEAIKALK